jgi:hypothetical protein
LSGSGAVFLINRPAQQRAMISNTIMATGIRFSPVARPTKRSGVTAAFEPGASD